MTDTCNRDYWDKQFPGIFKPIPKAQQSFAQPTPSKPKRKVVATPLPMPSMDGATFVIPLPLPPVKLQPNKAVRLHWQEKGRLAKAMRQACGFVAAQIKPSQPLKRARIDITTWTANKVDPPNVWQWCKSAIDAMQDAGIIENDRDLECGDIRGFYGKTNNRREMEFRITPL